MLDYALGEGMKQEVNDNVYRVAFESAKTELGEISATFEQLRLRKDRIEKLVSVLKPLVGVEEQTGSSGEQSEGLPQEAKIATDGGSNEEPEQLLPDPFQRRIDHVLGIGAGVRDITKYSRQF
jgi:hypothetical protein